MMFLSEAASLLTTYPGNLVYHLTLAITLALIYSAAQVQGSANLQEAIPRSWRFAGAGLLAIRLLFMAVAGLSSVVILDLSAILPPLDRTSSFAGILILGWAVFQPSGGQKADRLLVAGLFLAMIGLVGTVFAQVSIPSSSAFNRTTSDLVWGLASVLTGIAIAFLLSLYRPPQWHLSLGAFGLLIVGFALHFVMGSTTESLAGIVRLSELTAYPLFALIAVRMLVIPSKTTEEPQAEQTIAAAESESSMPMEDLETIIGLARMTTAEGLDELANSAAQAVGQAMRAEYCFLVSAPDEFGEFSIATGYDLIRERHLPGKALSSSSFPVISTALNRRRSLTLPSQSRSPDLKALRSLLQLEVAAPALMAPLMDDERMYGGLLLLSPYARRRWSKLDRQVLEQVAGHLARRFTQLKQAALKEEEISNTLNEALTEAQQRAETLERENVGLLQQLEALSAEEDQAQAEHLASLIAMHEEAQQTIENLEAEIERLSATQTESSPEGEGDEIDRLASELQLALRELAATKQSLHAAEANALSQVGPAQEPPDFEAIASIAQELRQPMSSILGYTDLLLSESVGLLGAMQRKFLERVRSGIERMGTLMSDLIQVTALESGTLSLTTTSVDLLHCIEEAVMQTSASLRERNLALRMDFPDEIPPVLGNEDAITQIMIHLIENAIGASPEGEEVVAAAHTQDSEDGTFVVVSVSDVGDGIPAEDIGRVFKRIYEADTVLIQGFRW